MTTVSAVFQGKSAPQKFSHVVNSRSPIWPCECKMRRLRPESRSAEDLSAQPLAAAGSDRRGAVLMEEDFGQVGPRERQIIDLLLQGCDNSENRRSVHAASDQDVVEGAGRRAGWKREAAVDGRQG